MFPSPPPLPSHTFVRDQSATCTLLVAFPVQINLNAKARAAHFLIAKQRFDAPRSTQPFALALIPSKCIFRASRLQNLTLYRHFPIKNPHNRQSKMSPTYTMTGHLCKQIYTSWRQSRHPSPEPSTPTTATTVVTTVPTTTVAAAAAAAAAASRTTTAPSSPTTAKTSMDSVRSDGGWRFPKAR
jgi:hypothetical protein